MGFLTPLWLVLSAAVAIPLILHLLQRHQGPRVIFPAIRYLQQAEREHARQIRLRQLILLLLRIAAVLLLALAAARPFMRSAGIGHEPSAVVLVLDNSLSSGLVSGDRRVLDELKDRALETLGRAGPDDRFWLLRAGSPWEPALPGDATTIATRVRETKPTAAQSDLVAAVARAGSILAQGAEGRAREIEVLSDLQTTNLHGSLNQGTDKGSGLGVVLWAPRRGPQNNAAVEAVTVGGGLAPRAGERSTVVAQVAGNTGDSINVRLLLDGRIAGAAVTRPGAAAVIPFPPRPARLVLGAVQIDADALRADDQRFFVATIAPPPRVTLARAVPFVSEALTVLADAHRISVGAGGSDVIIAPAGSGAENAAPNQSVVVLAPETPLELPAVNRHLAALRVNWRYQQNPVTGEHRFAPTAQTDELSRSLASARVLRSYQLVPNGQTRTDSVMLRLDDGSAWAVRGTRPQGGHFVLLASPLKTDATTLPTSPAMIPLLDHATGEWSAPDATRSEAEPGERISLPAGAEQIIEPAGNRISVANQSYFDAATDPGAYQVVSRGHVIGAFVVNGAAAESDLHYSDGRRVARMLAPLDVKRAASPGAWQRAVNSHRVGREVWRFTLLVLFALLIVEAIAAATGRVGRTAPAAAEA